ncbi:MAG: CDP-diacylglycerol--serine O-phosphatidyltransferase [Deltaproteobacteria bacterium]|nr:CDP-diacylglycerol--serine O-phosphatidyltransferase [Deltaproteobacteria bacterium]
MEGMEGESAEAVKVTSIKSRRARPLVLLPHLFTTAGLFCGFYSIVMSTTGNFDHAAYGIIFAGLFDLFDGSVARMVHAESAFGEQYDSLADVIGFGVAPAMLAFSAGGLHDLGRVGWVCAFFYVVCAALRLARFNVSPSIYKDMFQGLPSPAAGGIIATTTWFVQFLRQEQGLEFTVHSGLISAGVVFLGFLMVSNIPYRSSKVLSLRADFRTLVLIPSIFVCIIMKPAITLFLIGMTYLVVGLVELLWRRKTGNALESILPDDEYIAGEEGGNEL